MNPVTQREPRLSMPKLLAHANGQPCTVRHPEHCNDNGQNVVAAHYNWMDGGKGKGVKVHDTHIAYACDGCHRFLDNAAATPVSERKLWWLRGHLRTIYMIVRDGVLK